MAITDHIAPPGEPTFGYQERHRAVFDLNVSALVDLLKTGQRTVNAIVGIPAGATIYGVQYDPIREVWQIGVEHPSFPAVPEGGVPWGIDIAVEVTEIIGDQDPPDA